MTYRNRFVPVLRSALLAFSASGCSNVDLVCTSSTCKPAAQEILADNKVTVQGQACTASPDSVGFSYKILFIIDVSGSTGPQGSGANATPGSDPTGGRGRAVSQVLQSCASNPMVSYAMMTFDSQPNLIQPQFTDNIPLLQSDVPPGQLAPGLHQLC